MARALRRRRTSSCWAAIRVGAGFAPRVVRRLAARIAERAAVLVDSAVVPGRDMDFVRAGPARTQIKALIRELLARHPGFGLAGEVRPLCSDFINGIKHLPVRFDRDS
ncbi:MULTISPECIES: hypothetical protein [unclassified Streptomyces]|uniref:hypothetical protein n=1 Tax=unclassified Streptomyces TaxID=2593676 RepID=UPI00343921C6